MRTPTIARFLTSSFARPDARVRSTTWTYGAVEFDFGSTFFYNGGVVRRDEGDDDANDADE